MFLQLFGRGKSDDQTSAGESDDQEEQDRGRHYRRLAIIFVAATIPVLVGLLVVIFFLNQPATYGEQIRLDEFFTLVEEGAVQEATILDYDTRVIGESVRGRFWVEFGNTETAFQQVLSQIQGAGVPTTIRAQWYKSMTALGLTVVPLLLMVLVLVLIGLLMWGRVRGEGDTFGKSGAKQLGEGESKITFADVAGQEEATEELAEIRDYLSAPERFLAMGAAVPKGILLVGSPGCGKTLLARAVAGEAGVPFYSMSGSGFVEMFVGVGSARIRDLFRTAKANAPCIVFIDELDAVGRGRAGGGAVGGQDERETTLNQLLVELDGFELASGVVVLAATNRPDVLDPALLRPGRFDRRVMIDRPDIKGRSGILNIHARGKPLGPDTDLEQIAKRTAGFAGADLANIVNEAALLSARRGLTEIHQAELVEAIERVLHGPERRSRVLSPRDRRLIAYHEAGHVIAAAAVPEIDIPQKVSIVGRGHAGGMTWFTQEEELVFVSRSQMLNRIMILAAGRAAEERLTGESSTGAHNDLERATELARNMVAELGMGESLGPVSVNRALQQHPEMGLSSGLASEIDAEVKSLLADALKRAHELLERHREVWEQLAAKLLEVESLEGPDLEMVLEPMQPTGSSLANPNPSLAGDAAGSPEAAQPPEAAGPSEAAGPPEAAGSSGEADSTEPASSDGQA
jgi:cell division protease FtsH